jgi:hypothetical protein
MILPSSMGIQQGFLVVVVVCMFADISFCSRSQHHSCHIQRQHYEKTTFCHLSSMISPSSMSVHKVFLVVGVVVVAFIFADISFCSYSQHCSFHTQSIHQMVALNLKYDM